MKRLAIACLAVAAVAAKAQDLPARLQRELVSLGYADGKLPKLAPPFGQYVEAVQTGQLLHLTSTAPMSPDGKWLKGRVPDATSVDGAIVAAKLACMRQIARLQSALGDLERVKRVVSVRLLIASTPEFAEHTKIADACSSVFVNVFGDAGRHTRTSEGVASLPFGVTLEAEALLQPRHRRVVLAHVQHHVAEPAHRCDARAAAHRCVDARLGLRGVERLRWRRHRVTGRLVAEHRIDLEAIGHAQAHTHAAARAIGGLHRARSGQRGQRAQVFS